MCGNKYIMHLMMHHQEITVLLILLMCIVQYGQCRILLSNLLFEGFID